MWSSVLRKIEKKASDFHRKERQQSPNSISFKVSPKGYRMSFELTLQYPAEQAVSSRIL
jgi:hypothetical protein